MLKIELITKEEFSRVQNEFIIEFGNLDFNSLFGCRGHSNFYDFESGDFAYFNSGSFRSISSHDNPVSYGAFFFKNCWWIYPSGHNRFSQSSIQFELDRRYKISFEVDSVSFEFNKNNCSNLKEWKLLKKGVNDQNISYVLGKYPIITKVTDLKGNILDSNLFVLEISELFITLTFNHPQEGSVTVIKE